MCSDESSLNSNQSSSSGLGPRATVTDQGINLALENFQPRLRGNTPLIPGGQIANLRGRVERFDLKNKEIVELPLEEVIKDRLLSFFGESSLDSVRRINPVQITSLVNGSRLNSRMRLSQLVVLPEVPITSIPDSRVDPRGILSILEEVTTLRSAVVLFSSPDLSPDHHNKLLNYVLSWPDRVNLRRESLIDRINSGRQCSLAAEWRSLRKIDYEKIVFKDCSDNEWSAHILLSSPNYEQQVDVNGRSDVETKYSEVLKIAGLNPKHPLRVIDKGSDIKKLLEGKDYPSGQKFDIIDMKTLGPQAKQNFFKTTDGLGKLLSVLSERGVILFDFNDRLESRIKHLAEGQFRKAILEQAKRSVMQLDAARERLNRSWDSQPYTWLRQLEHRVLSAGTYKDSHLLLSKEMKASALPEILVDASPEFKRELVARYKNGSEFRQLVDNPRRATAKKVMNFVLDELLGVYDGQLTRLTPISKLSEMFSIERKAITYYHDILLRSDVRMLVTQERIKSARLTRDSVVAEVEREVEAYVKGEIERFSNDQFLRDKYQLHGGQVKKYLNDGLSSWANRCRNEALAIVPSSFSAIRNSLHRSIIQHVREQLRQYHETGEPVSKLADLSKKFHRSPSKINRVIHLYLSSDEQAERMLATPLPDLRKPKPKSVEKMSRALDSVKTEIAQLQAGKLEHITLLSHRASHFKICEIRLREAIKNNLSKDEFAIYSEAVSKARHAFKTQYLRKPKPKSVEKMSRALDSVKTEIAQLQAGKLEHITLLSYRANHFKISKIRLREAIKNNLSKDEFAIYSEAVSKARRAFKAQLSKQNQTRSKKR